MPCRRHSDLSRIEKNEDIQVKSIKTIVGATVGRPFFMLHVIADIYNRMVINKNNFIVQMVKYQ